jgi:hypothetical protein
MAKVQQQRALQSHKGLKAKQRSCLRCDRVFASEGAHNRMCESCRHFLADSASPAEEYSLTLL